MLRQRVPALATLRHSAKHYEHACFSLVLQYVMLFNYNTKGSSSGDVAPSLLHHHASSHLCLKQPPKFSNQNNARKSSQTLLPRSVTHPTIEDVNTSLFLYSDSSQIVGRQHRQKRQLQIRCVYRYRRHVCSLHLHWIYKRPQHIEKRRANASHKLPHHFDSPLGIPTVVAKSSNESSTLNKYAR